MNYRWPLYIFLVLVIFPMAFGAVRVEVGTSFAGTSVPSDFSFVPFSETQAVCVSSTFTVPIAVTNLNSFSEEFSFSVDKAYAILSSSGVVLPAGKGSILLITVVPEEEIFGNDSLLFSVQTKREGLRRSFSVPLAFRKCYGFRLLVEGEPQDVCGCDAISIGFVLAHEGEAEDTYSIDYVLPPTLNGSELPAIISLGQNDRRNFQVSGRIPCTVAEKVSIGVLAASGKTGLAKGYDKTFSVQSLNSCYGLDIGFKNVRTTYDGELVPISIENKGSRDVTYDISVGGIDWYVLSIDKISLGVGASKIIYLHVKPTEEVAEGTYQVALNLSSANVDIVKEISVTLKKRNSAVRAVLFYLNLAKYYLIVLAVGAAGVLISYPRLKASRKLRAEKREGIQRKIEEKRKLEKERLEEKKVRKESKVTASTVKAVSDKRIMGDEKKTKISLSGMQWAAIIIGGIIILGIIGAWAYSMQGSFGFELVQVSVMEKVAANGTSILTGILVVGGLALIMFLPQIWRRVKKKKLFQVSFSMVKPRPKEKKNIQAPTVTARVPAAPQKGVDRGKRDFWGDLSIVFIFLIGVVVVIGAVELLKKDYMPVVSGFLVVYYPYLLAGVGILLLALILLKVRDSDGKK